jgi:hypothetical protein
VSKAIGVDRLRSLPEDSNFWDWISQPEFDLFLEVASDMLMDENSTHLHRHLSLGENAATARLAALQTVFALRKEFPRESNQLIPQQQEYDIENDVS